MAPVIQVENVYKRYQIASTINFRTLFKDLSRTTQARQQRVRNVAERFVLEDINFALESGDSLGLIGNNGSGKSTLLRLLAGVSLPTRGRVRVQGRLAPLLSLGAGFHPELTGRENLYLNCTLLGLSFAQVRDRIDSIIDFSELHEYIEVPIKRYSSGMLARLGFAAAVHLDADVILIDEVLAVGDYSFYVKSTSAIRNFLDRGTVIFVSHDLGSVEKLCRRAIWLHEGHVKADGPSTDVIYQYTSFQQGNLTVQPATGQTAGSADGSSQSTEASSDDQSWTQKQQFDPAITVHDVEVFGSSDNGTREFNIPDTFVIRCKMTSTRPLLNLRVVIGIIDTETKALVTAADNQNLGLDSFGGGTVHLEARFPDLHLRPRHYGVYVGLSDPTALAPYYIWRDLGMRFYVKGERRSADLHYWAPQADLLFTPGVDMRVINVTEADVTVSK